MSYEEYKSRLLAISGAVEPAEETIKYLYEKYLEQNAHENGEEVLS